MGRLDSGDLGAHASQVRQILDRGGLRETVIFASGNLDEYQLSKFMAANAPIDGFGIGTALDISIDVPEFDCVYKLQEYASIPRRKRSEGKATWPGRKQVYRIFNDAGWMKADTIALEDNDPQKGQSLLQPVMLRGERCQASQSSHEIRQQTLQNYASFPASLGGLQKTTEYPVPISSALQVLAYELDAQIL